MFRTPTSIFSVKSILFCRSSREFQLSPVLRLPTNIDSRPRKKHQPGPPPPPIKEINTDKLVFGGMAVLVVTGFAVMCAHNSPEVRDILSLHAPWLDDIIAFLYQENMTYQEYIDGLVYDVKENMLLVKKYVDTLKLETDDQAFPDRQSLSDVPGTSTIIDNEGDIDTRR